jgi:hypothetical protein
MKTGIFSRQDGKAQEKYFSFLQPGVLCVPSMLLRTCFAIYFGNTGRRNFSSLNRALQLVIPAWSAGIQIYMDVFGHLLANLMDAGNPCRHDEDLHFDVLQASVRS